MRFSQGSAPGVVEDECCLRDGADPAGAEGDVLEGAPALFEYGHGAFTGEAQAAEEFVVGLVADADVAGQVGVLAEGNMDVRAGTDVSDVGRRGQAVMGRLVEVRQGMDAGRGQVMGAAGLDIGDPQRCAVGCGEELYVPGEVFDPDRVPEVGAVFGFSGHAVSEPFSS